jgi:cell division protein FtsB
MGRKGSIEPVQAVGGKITMARWYEKRSYSGKGGNAKKILYLFVIVVGVVFLLKNGYSYFCMKNQRDSLKQEIEELKKKNETLSARAANLYNDREYVEKAAREQLNLAKDGETVIIIKNDK